MGHQKNAVPGGRPRPLQQHKPQREQRQQQQQQQQQQRQELRQDEPGLQWTDEEWEQEWPLLSDEKKQRLQRRCMEQWEVWKAEVEQRERVRQQEQQQQQQQAQQAHKKVRRPQPRPEPQPLPLQQQQAGQQESQPQQLRQQQRLVALGAPEPSCPATREGRPRSRLDDDPRSADDAAHEEEGAEKREQAPRRAPTGQLPPPATAPQPPSASPAGVLAAPSSNRQQDAAGAAAAAAIPGFPAEGDPRRDPYLAAALKIGKTPASMHKELDDAAWRVHDYLPAETEEGLYRDVVWVCEPCGVVGGKYLGNLGCWRKEGEGDRLVLPPCKRRLPGNKKKCWKARTPVPGTLPQDCVGTVLANTLRQKKRRDRKSGGETG